MYRLGRCIPGRVIGVQGPIGGVLDGRSLRVERDGSEVMVAQIAVGTEDNPIFPQMHEASALLEEALHDGLSRLRPGFGERAASATAALGAVGLEGAARRVGVLAEAIRTNDAASARAWLDAAIRLELTREATLGITTTEP